ncbi:alpha/beta hydrolase [Methanoregula sp.]|uniref:alpha/beta fold hydrolase n=1 Tax=Methanoregula sp. TaxID=2052170 RepID=UPI00262EF021|nr:alpha/beta hydrolase [Methanoregula sp.]MDD5142123.1 alpha/beta hydrolase [Methanoregula sp.]
MKPVRKWGPGPYTVAVIHGGPGAPGEMAPVARELSSVAGVLEPFQTETTLEGQVQELRSVLSQHGMLPVTLVGFSWGAFLSWILAARYPDQVKKLILVGCPPFVEEHAASISRTRMARLKKTDRDRVNMIIEGLDGTTEAGKNALLAELGILLARADAYDPANVPEEGFHCQYDVFRGVWDEAAELRRKQAILHMSREIRCPVVAIHGDWDPHPADGVNGPLKKALPDFEFILLEKCGHRPWIERGASEKFYKVLVEAI